MYKIKQPVLKRLIYACLTLCVLSFYFVFYNKENNYKTFGICDDCYSPRHKTSEFLSALGGVHPAEDYVPPKYKKKAESFNAIIKSEGTPDSKLLKFEIYTLGKKLSQENILSFTEMIRSSYLNPKERLLTLCFFSKNHLIASRDDIYFITYTSNQNTSTPLITRIGSFWSWVKHPQYFFSIYYAKK